MDLLLAAVDHSSSGPTCTTTAFLSDAPVELPDNAVACISEIANGAEVRSAWLLKFGVVTVGRDGTSTLPVHDKYASRQHLAIVSSSSGEIWLIDTSTSGTVISAVDTSPLSVRCAGIQVGKTVEVYVGCRLRNGERYPKNSSRFRIICMKPSVEDCVTGSCTPWLKVPLAIKDVVKCLPMSRINLKKLGTEDVKTPCVQEETRRKISRSNICSTESAKTMQAFSIYDFWSKKPPLPVTRTPELSRSVEDVIKNEFQVTKQTKQKRPVVRSKLNHKRASKLLQQSSSEECLAACRSLESSQYVGVVAKSDNNSEWC